MDRWKAEMGRVREEKRRRKKIKEEKFRRKKIQMREKVGKSRFIVFFQRFVAPEGRKVGLLKRRVRSHVARWEIKNCTPLWRESHSQVKKLKTPHVRNTFGSCDVEKARSTFPSQNVQITPCSDHFWKLRCRKTARRCGAKHISMLKVEKTEGFGALFQVEMSKKCTPLWCKPYFQVKSGKNWRVRSTFEFRFRFAWPTQGIVHLVKSEQNEGSVAVSATTTPLHYNYNYITLHYTNYITLHSTPLHSTALTTTTTTLHYATLH